MTAFDQSFKDLIEVEGGYSDDARDLGGKTNWGITEAVARNNDYTGDMKDLRKDEAKRIYKSQYWDIQRLDDVADLSGAVAHELFDTGVNMGVKRAGEFLQRSLNALNNGGRLYPDLEVDGMIGPASVAALRKYIGARGSEGITILMRALNCLQGARYIELAEAREQNEAFLYGWLRTRVQ